MDEAIASHVMTAESAASLLTAFDRRGTTVIVGGGWAVDALLREQTRPHGDLDLWVAVDEFEPVIATLVAERVDRLFPWPGDRPWNFVVHDGRHRRVDLHTYERIDSDAVYYGGITRGERFAAGNLSGNGMIGGVEVRCDTPEWALECHAGYPPRAVDHHDVQRLCARFGFDLPSQYR